MDDDKLPMSSVILFGTISVTIVSLLSLGGACIGPLMANDAKHRWLHFFLAMAISTLSSDAILHIIPQIVGVHEHGTRSSQKHGHSHEKKHEHSEKQDHAHEDVMWYTVTNSRQILLRLSVVVLAIYVLYFVEFFLFYRKTHLHFCSPSTKSAISGPVLTSGSHMAKSCQSDSSGIESNNNAAGFDEVENDCKTDMPREKGGHELISLREDDEDSGEICGLKPRALIILFGDGLHNLVDGIAIGASFMVSLKLGIVTTIAVICHELPHEIGDLAVLIDSGLSMVKALILNLISALTAYIGLFIAIALGKDDETEKTLLAITAGMFLFVAWVDMLSHLKHDALMADHWMVTSILQISGFLVGFLLIFGLGWFEHVFDS